MENTNKKKDHIILAKTNRWIGFQFHPEKYKETFDFFILPFLTTP